MKSLLRIIVYIFAAIGFILVSVYIALELGLTNTEGIVDNQRNHFRNELASYSSLWQEGEEWEALEAGLKKDKEYIFRAATDADINPRLIVSIVVAEQLRLFHSERELFKSVFAPLKMLASQSQFSWGVAGIKQDTAILVEKNLKDKDSLFYLGESKETLLDFRTDNHDNERFQRITDEHDRYYSYLYAGLMMKEIMAQWSRSGFTIDSKPEIIATLYNIGFSNSRPKANPQVGGAEIFLNGTSYSFGSLAALFYYSDKLKTEFP